MNISRTGDTTNRIQRKEKNTLCHFVFEELLLHHINGLIHIWRLGRLYIVILNS